jgi:hypothetical protein
MRLPKLRIPHRYPSGRQIPPELQAGLKKHLEQLRVEPITGRSAKKRK